MSLEYLKTIGKAKEGITSSLNTSPVGKVASKFAIDMIQEMKNNVSPSNATGALSASLSFEFGTGEAGVLELDFLAEDYWDFINSGVNGFQGNFGSAYSFAEYAKTGTDGQTFNESIKAWMAAKGIVAEDGDYDSLAYVIMQSVKKNGIEATHFVDKALTDKAISTLENDLFNAFQTML
jgi:hypothetical protein